MDDKWVGVIDGGVRVWKCEGEGGAGAGQGARGGKVALNNFSVVAV